MSPELKPGLRHVQTLGVDHSLTVPAVSKAFAFEDMPPVFATAFMVGFIEWACIEALRPYLDADERTVGTHVDVSHTAATPVGMTVTAEIELIAIEGRKFRFKVACRDDAGPIGEGFHERAVIDLARFMARVAAKAG
jgi:fluoroacetyl-CoA thioesterase